MKDTGEPERLGEVLHQAGATATATHDDDGNLIWQVRRRSDGRITPTAVLAHTACWQPDYGWAHDAEVSW